MMHLPPPPAAIRHRSRACRRRPPAPMNSAPWDRYHSQAGHLAARPTASRPHVLALAASSIATSFPCGKPSVLPVGEHDKLVGMITDRDSGPEKADSGSPRLLGTESSNPPPSSGQPVSRTNRAAAGRDPRVSRGCAPLGWRRGRQRRAGLVNTPTADYISVGRFSSTAVPAKRFAHCGCTGAPSEVGRAM
jgi:hypothetical protein